MANNELDFAVLAALAKSLGGSADPAVIEAAVSDWLDDHPEATTTVEDGSITKAKLDSNLQGTVDDVSDLKTEISSISERSNNLFNPVYLVRNSNGNITESNGIYSGTADAFSNAFNSAGKYYPMPEFKANTQYTFSIKAKNDGANGTTGNGLQFNIHYTDSSIGVAAISNSQTTWGGFSTGSGTFTSASGKTISKICITYNTYSARMNVWQITDIQIEEGTTATTFKPYITAIDVYAREEASKAIVPTINLFDPKYLVENSNGAITESGGVYKGTASAFSTYFGGANSYPMPAFKANTQYTISAVARNDGANGTTGNGLQFNIYYTDETVTVAAFSNSQTKWGNIPAGAGYVVTTSGKTVAKVCITYNSYAERMNIWEIKDIQFEENITATPYLPIETSQDFVARQKISEYDEVNRELLNARHIKNDSVKPFTLLHFSDLHADKGALVRILDDAKKYEYYIDDKICTGDMVADTSEEIDSWWDESVLTCIGNHDTASYSSGTGYNWTALSMANRDAYYIAPFEDNWGITHTEGTSYYYKDYSDSKVRLIVMDVMLYNDNGEEATAQTAWLESLLADAITNNLHVLIAIHAPHGGATAEVCSFSRYGQTAMPVNSDCDTPQAVIDAVATKITGGLKFIGYIVGHTHQDNIWDAENDGTQLMYCVTCGVVSNRNQWKYADLHRGITFDAYNLITVDTSNTIVKIVRCGGANVDDHMRTRKAICFNYSTGEKVVELL